MMSLVVVVLKCMVMMSTVKVVNVVRCVVLTVWMVLVPTNMSMIVVVMVGRRVLTRAMMNVVMGQRMVAHTWW